MRVFSCVGGKIVALETWVAYKAPSPLMTVAVLVAWSILVMIASTSRVGGHGPNTKPLRFILA